MLKVCAALVAAWLAVGLATQTHADIGDQASAEQSVRKAYLKYQAACTPTEPAHVQSISWDSFHAAGSSPSGRIGGSGVIHDTDAALGGPFMVAMDVGAALPPGALKVDQWDIVFEFC